MSYLALYRKYRPQTFSEVVGQEAVVKALRNQVKYARIGHAYVFCGTHGTGKTTLARVFAKAVNCLHPVDGNPCGECEFCRSASASLDIIEIDAASNTGVDNIRELREEVAYAPVAGRYKVYIIDEAHMLSAQAFNALLKTLEEPPEHAIFILATTEPQKLLTTILSRCQRYDFGRLTQEQIYGQLKDIAAREGLSVEDEALSYMASHVDGSSRDALSLLDQCRAYFTEEEITLAKVLDVLGAVDSSVLTGMTGALASGDAVALLRYVDDVFRQGRDPLQLVASLASYLRGVLMFGVMGNEADKYVSDGPAARSAMAEQSKRVTPSQLTFFIQELSKLNNQIRFAAYRRVLLETGLVAIASGRASGMGDAALSARIDQVEAKINALKAEGLCVAPAAPLSFASPAEGYNRPAPETPAERKTEAPRQTGPAAPARPASSYTSASEKTPARPVREEAPAAAARPAQASTSNFAILFRRFIEQNVTRTVMQACLLEEGEEPDTLVMRGNDFSLKLAVGTGGANLRQLEEFIEQQTGKKYTVVTGPMRADQSPVGSSSQAEPAKSMKDLLGNIGGNIEWK